MAIHWALIFYGYTLVTFYSSCFLPLWRVSYLPKDTHQAPLTVSSLLKPISCSCTSFLPLFSDEFFLGDYFYFCCFDLFSERTNPMLQVYIILTIIFKVTWKGRMEYISLIQQFSLEGVEDSLNIEIFLKENYTREFFEPITL